MNIRYFLLLVGFSCFAQNNNLTLTPEFFSGITLPSTSNFPKTTMQTAFGLSLGRKNEFKDKEWTNIMKFPTTGISLFYTNFGNSKKIGYAISVLPYIEFNILKKKQLKTKLAFGFSYFNKQYHAINNPLNQAISSDFTWALQVFLYYDLKIKNFNFTLGAGNFHHSNGHTSLPNFGLNSALLSFSTKFDVQKPKISDPKITFDKTKIKKFGDWFYSVRYGRGFQTFLEDLDKIKTVDAISLNGGIYYKNAYKLRFGVNYRYYKHYYDYISENMVEPYIDNPFANASNIYISIGGEALVGRVGIDVEGGLNLYKPFFKKHYLLTDYKHDFKYELKKLFLGRLGLKLYAINNAKNPLNNFYLAAHINSNLSQADFSEISFGFTHRFKNK